MVLLNLNRILIISFHNINKKSMKEFSVCWWIKFGKLNKCTQCLSTVNWCHSHEYKKYTGHISILFCVFNFNVFNFNVVFNFKVHLLISQCTLVGLLYRMLFNTLKKKVEHIKNVQKLFRLSILLVSVSNSVVPTFFGNY